MSPWLLTSLTNYKRASRSGTRPVLLKFQSQNGFEEPAKHASKGVGDREEKERDWGERVRHACYKNPLLSIVRKFLIGCAVMSKLLACILACIYSERQTR